MPLLRTPPLVLAALEQSATYRALAERERRDRGRRVHVYKNGSRTFLGRLVVVSDRRFPTWGHLLEEFTDLLQGRASVDRVFECGTWCPVVSVSQMTHGGQYVACCQGERLDTSLDYVNIRHTLSSERGGDTTPPPSYDPTTVNKVLAAKHIRPTYRQYEPTIMFLVYKNGDIFTAPKRIACSSRTMWDWDSLLDHISQQMNLGTGQVRYLYTTEGRLVQGPHQLTKGQAYVACGHYEKFKSVDYLGTGDTPGRRPWALRRRLTWRRTTHSSTPPHHSTTPPHHSTTPPHHSTTPPHHSTTPPQHTTHHSTTRPRYESSDAPLVIFVHRNGDMFRPAKTVLLNRVQVQSWSAVLEEVNNRVEVSSGHVSRLYDLAGHLLTGVSQLVQFGQYVACGHPSEEVQVLPYDQVGVESLLGSRPGNRPLPPPPPPPPPPPTPPHPSPNPSPPSRRRHTQKEAVPDRARKSSDTTHRQRVTSRHHRDKKQHKKQETDEQSAGRTPTRDIEGGRRHGKGRSRKRSRKSKRRESQEQHPGPRLTVHEPLSPKDISLHTGTRVEYRDLEGVDRGDDRGDDRGVDRGDDRGDNTEGVSLNTLDYHDLVGREEGEERVMAEPDAKSNVSNTTTDFTFGIQLHILDDSDGTVDTADIVFNVKMNPDYVTGQDTTPPVIIEAVSGGQLHPIQLDDKRTLESIVSKITQ